MIYVLFACTPLGLQSPLCQPLQPYTYTNAAECLAAAAKFAAIAPAGNVTKFRCASKPTWTFVK